VKSIRIGIVLVACAASAWVACSSDGASSSSGGGSSSSGGSDAAAAADVGAAPDSGSGADASDGAVDYCNELAQDGVPTDIVASSAKQPDPAGGTIAEGTYVGAGAIAYTTLFPEGSKVGDLAAVTLVIKGNTVEELTTYSAVNKERSKGTFTTTGAAIKIDVACQWPASAQGLPPPTGYTVSGDTLALFTTVNSIPAQLKLTKKK